MKVVATWSFEPWFKREGVSWQHTSEMLAAARAAIELANKNYGQPTVYVDSYGKYIFEQLAPCADYRVVYNDLYGQIPTEKLWAYAKILTYQRQQQPYLHFDLDFLCLKRWPESVFDCDVMFQSYENLEEKAEKISLHYNLPSVGRYYKLPALMQRDDPNVVKGANLGVMFMNNMELNKQYTFIAQQIVEMNNDVFKTPNVLGMCVIEQHLMGMILESNPAFKVNTIRPMGWDLPMWDEYYIHFVGHNYKSAKYAQAQKLRKQVLGPWINDKIRRLSDEIQNERNRRTKG